jgi:hypothetical protein
VIDAALIDRGDMFIDDRGRCRRGNTEHLLERRVAPMDIERV